MNKVEETKGSNKKINVRNMVQIAMLAAIATVLMLFEIPLWFAPSFYEIDLSDVAVLIGTFSMGPLAGAIIELVKILLNLFVNGTITAGVGEFANFLIGCALCVPAGIIYRRNKTRNGAVVGLLIGVLTMTLAGCLLNAYVLLPTYAVVFGMPISALVDMGKAVNPSITSLTTFVLFAVAPFNLLKGFIVSFITILLYKKVSPILHQSHK